MRLESLFIKFLKHFYTHSNDNLKELAMSEDTRQHLGLLLVNFDIEDNFIEYSKGLK